MTDHYKVLGVSRSATQLEIRAAFLALAKATHPDHNPGDATKEARFKTASAAYELLSDPSKRAQHDLELLMEEIRSRKVAANPVPKPVYSRGRAASPPPPPPPSPPSPPSPRMPARNNTNGGAGGFAAAALGILGLFGAAVIADSRRTTWDPDAQRRRGRDGRFRPTDSWW
jgi:curved DNA-binding protein CbpA